MKIEFVFLLITIDKIPFLLNQTIKHHLNTHDEDIANEILNSLYVPLTHSDIDDLFL